ncbi:MAG TPA: membrane dipeptidase [Bryobacteraceae bacterium]|jgi:membrane dipeptidase
MEFPKYLAVNTRRAFFKTGLTAGACALAAPFFNTRRFELFADAPTRYSGVTLDLIQESTVIDMLGLLTLDYRKWIQWVAKPETFHEADFQRLKESGTTVFHPAVGFTGGDAFMESLRDITGWDILLSAHPNKFLRIDTIADIVRAKAQGKLGIVLGLQNSVHFRTVDDVQRFYKLGQRVSQLTYDDNAIGGGSTDPRNEGLTPYGARIVDCMNQLGMAIDVSHCADRTTLDTIEASAKPVLVTHSNCRAIVPGSARCKSDEVIRKLAAKGGVMGVTMVRYFVNAGSRVTMENVLDHIDHIVKIAGIEHVGIGTDVDLDGRDKGTPARRQDLDGADYSRKIYDLTEGLVRRKYSKQDIALVLGGNFQRALGEIWSKGQA